ncbi:MAG: NAD-dependent epimerase/dehydratase family protein [Pseudomonadota bacterium]
MTKVFVTGASGFIAKHILRELLEKGYEIGASVRSERRKSEIEALFPDANISFAFLDLLGDDGWEHALQGSDVLMHTASPFPLSEPKDPNDLIRPAVDGTLRAMKAAKAAGIKRVILTSSNVAIYKDAQKSGSQPSDEHNWTSPDDPAVSSYEASKTLAERAAWDFVADNPEIALTTINPGLVVGPAMDKHYGTSLDIIQQMMTGKMPMVPPVTMPCVDVRDVAMMHVAAIENDATKGQRYAATADNLPFIDLGNMVKAADSTAKAPKSVAPIWLLKIMGIFLKDVKMMLPNIGRNLTVTGAKAERDFEFKYIAVSKAIDASVKSIKQFPT